MGFCICLVESSTQNISFKTKCDSYIFILHINEALLNLTGSRP